MLASAASGKFPAVNKAWYGFFQCPGLGAQVITGLATSVTKYNRGRPIEGTGDFTSTKHIFPSHT